MMIEIDIFWNGTTEEFSSELEALSNLAATIQQREETEQLGKIASDLTKVLQPNQHKLNNAFFPFIRIASRVLEKGASQSCKNIVQRIPLSSIPPLPSRIHLQKWDAPLENASEQPDQQQIFNAAAVLVSQEAYLNSWLVFLAEDDNFELKKQLEERMFQQTESSVTPLEQQSLQIGIDEKVAEKVLGCFHESPLSLIFNQFLEAGLAEAKVVNVNPQMIADRVARNTHRYIKEHINDKFKDNPPHLIEQLANECGGRLIQDLEAYKSIDLYLKEVIARKPQEKVFDEDFKFADIYVSLQIKPVKDDGQINENAESQDIGQWATEILQDPEKQNRVLFIQGGPGRGKSVFCRMFADTVRRELCPIWIPILIRLRDIKELEYDFDKTLKYAVGWNFAASNTDWLTDRNTRFLFLLDGFDELLMERGTGKALRDLLEQVSLFQQRCADSSERGHRVLITGRPLALYGIERLMPRNLERVEIIPMELEIQRQWLNRWAKIAGKEAKDAFSEFLEYCPEQVKTLAKEPLLLYLLAAMHKDPKNPLKTSSLAESSNADAKILIYQEVLEWVLNRQREDSRMGDLTSLLTGLDQEDLRSILEETGLCMVQSGKNIVSVAMLEKRLEEKEDEGAKKLLRTARESFVNMPLKNVLATFYLTAIPGTENSVEFIHKSFGEFLFAQQLSKRLKAWTEQPSDGRANYIISVKSMEWEIYDLLGYGGLTPEMVEYLMALLTTRSASDSSSQLWDAGDLVRLFERLENFYTRWCQGKFIDDVIVTDIYPMKKSQQLNSYRISVGQRQVDVYAGLNVMILLLELQRYAKSQSNDPELQNQIHFYICGKPKENGEPEDPTRLFRQIGYSYCVDEYCFRDTVGPFLKGANLKGAQLVRAHLINADFKNADFKKADLTGAYLIGADFKEADLTKANLNGANLEKANLEGAVLKEAQLIIGYIRKANFKNANLRKAKLCDADLRGVNFRETDLKEANLGGADLSHANLSGADLSDAVLSDSVFGDIRWNDKTNWKDAKGLLNNNTIPGKLRHQLEGDS